MMNRSRTSMINQTLMTAMVALITTSSTAGQKSTTGPRPAGAIDASAVSGALQSSFGGVVEAVPAFQPYYLAGDFNGDGHQDLVVVVQIRAPKSQLPAQARVINPFAAGPATFPANPSAEHKLALAVIHSWKTAPAAGSLLLVGESPILILEYDRSKSTDTKDLMQLARRQGQRPRGWKY